MGVQNVLFSTGDKHTVP